MPPQPERQLLAVLFADIQGYTAMMQTDEAGGRLVLRNFKETLTEQVPAFNGQIINFYGDGCLCTFKDSVKAANCAIKLQHLFRIAEPSTPVRIGLHKGYVSFEDGNAYGDAVNITSRIESFGVPNAVLISDKMRQEVVSKTAYQSVLLGTFQFKNVEKPMQIHALKGEGLVVPQKETLKGKGKLLPSKETKIKKWAIGALVLGLLLVINFYNPLATFSNSASKSLREARIAVLPFENKTGDAKLDIIGDMASDWVIQGLMYLDDIQLVGFENIQENIQYASIGDSSGSFARRTGAEKVVRGRYYISGDELIFQSQIIDLETGKIELTLPKVSGPKDDNAALVSELQAKFVTAFEAQDHNFSPGIAQNPPPHQAYQLFREGIDIYSEDAVESRNLFAQAIEMDSSFFWPYVWATASFFNEGKGQQADSTFALITQKIDFKSLNSFDRQWYTHWKALLDKDLPKAFKASLKILEKDPKQWFSNVEAGIIANNLNRPEKAVEIFKYLDPAHAPQDIELDTWWHNYYAHNLFRVDRFAEAKEIVQLIKPKFRKHWNYYDRLAEIYIFLNQYDQLEGLIKEMEDNQLPPQEMLNEFVFIAERLGVKGQKELQTKWAQAGLLWAQEQRTNLDPFALGNLYYLNDQFSVALPLFQEASEQTDNRWLKLSRLGKTYQKLEQLKAVQTVLDQLSTLYDATKDANYLVAQAHIYNTTADKDKAVTLFSRAVKKGFAYSPTTFGNDFMLASLQGYPPFEALIETK